MSLPFTTEQFYAVFREYNAAVWPAQPILVVLALAAVALVAVSRPWSSALVSAILGFLWAWLGLAYHLAFFAAINPLAYVFSGASLLGAAAFLWHGVVRRRLVFGWTPGVRAAVGLSLVVFALVVYPAWSYYAGQRYPASPTFGLPCPTTLFTIGLLAFALPPAPRSAFVVPVLWCFVGTQAAFLLGTPQDLGLALAGMVGLVLIARSRRPLAQSGAASRLER